MDIVEILKNEEGNICVNTNVPKAYKKRASLLCYEYNHTSPDEEAKRRNLLSSLLGTCHELTFIEPSFHCDFGFNIHTNGLTIINYNCVILETAPVHIGENAFIGPNVCLACAGHSMDSLQRAKGVSVSLPIEIGKDVWIGASSVVCGGVTIGDGSVIGAGSVVNKDIPSRVVAAGVPCRVIRPITEADKIKKELISF